MFLGMPRDTTAVPVSYASQKNPLQTAAMRPADGDHPPTLHVSYAHCCLRI